VHRLDIVTPYAEIELAHRRTHQAITRFIHFAELTHFCHPHVGVAVVPVLHGTGYILPIETDSLPFPRRLSPLRIEAELSPRRLMFDFSYFNISLQFE
jgi:hypothetical protein